VDPATIKTWDDFIAAGKKVREANPDVVMIQGDLNGDTEIFRMMPTSRAAATSEDAVDHR
jgi:lactose/L-arabinose transport system substrate-binding protein